MSNKKISSVVLLIAEIRRRKAFIQNEVNDELKQTMINNLDVDLDKYKAMHKEEIIETYWNGITQPKDKIKRERYYTKTFGGNNE